MAAVLNVSELLGDPATRRRARKAHKFTGQVRLIAISGARGDSSEIDNSATPYRIRDGSRGPLESHQHRDRLRRPADLAVEQRRQMPPGHTDTISHRTHRCLPTAERQQSPCALDLGTDRPAIAVPPGL